MLEPEKLETDIDGVVYSYSPMPQRLANQWLVKLIQHIGVPLGMAIEAFASGKEQEEDTLNALAFAAPAGVFVSGMASRMDVQFFEELNKAFAKRTTIKLDTGLVSLDQVFDYHFSRATKKQFQWLGWCLKEQYGDFLGDTSSIDGLEKLGAILRSLSSSQTS